MVAEEEEERRKRRRGAGGTRDAYNTVQSVCTVPDKHPVVSSQWYSIRRLYGGRRIEKGRGEEEAGWRKKGQKKGQKDGQDQGEGERGRG